MSKGGRPRKIGDAEKRLLRQLVEEKPLATLDEITEVFCTHTGLSVHHSLFPSQCHGCVFQARES